MFELHAEDMAVAAQVLQSRDDVNAARMGLVGNSQAGWIIPLAAAKVRPTFMIGGRPFTRVVFPGVGHSLAGAPLLEEIDRWLAAQ
jgi:hypothetical protein